jgi:hypothetical protein
MYLPSTDSCLHIRKCVGNKIPRHNTDSQNIGGQNRMLPMCWADIRDMLATDKNVCCLGGGADRHKSRHCQPRRFPPRLLTSAHPLHTPLHHRHLFLVGCCVSHCQSAAVQRQQCISFFYFFRSICHPKQLYGVPPTRSATITSLL